METPSWERYFLEIAVSVSRRATCPVRSVGAVFVNPDTDSILSVGYNGAPRGTAHCGSGCATRKQGENQSVCRAVHAETNAIYNAALNGVNLNGSDVYLTLSPCENCSKALIQVGVLSVTYLETSSYPLDWLDEAGIPHRRFTMVPWWDEAEEIDFV